MSEILNIAGPINHDNSIVKKEYHTYTPYTQSFNSNDEIRIAIQSQDLYVLPSESYIYMEVDVNMGEIGIAEPEFVNNFVAFFFSEIRYELNGVEIDRCKNPGITSNMKRYTSYRGTNMKMLNDAHEAERIATRTYRLILPLNSVLGFADDYHKVILNAKHELIMIRNRNDNHTYVCSENIRTLGFTVRKVHWKIPHVHLSDHSKLSMLRYLERKRTISIPYRSWDLYEMPQLPRATKNIWAVKTSTNSNKPRYVIVALQVNGDNNQTLNSSHFENGNVSDVKLFLNNDVYPYNNFDSDFPNNNYQEIHMANLETQKSYYGPLYPENPYKLTYEDFKNRVLFVIDCSHSDDSLLNSTVDVRIEINSRTNIENNTRAYCLIIHDNVVTYSPFDGIVNKTI